MKTIKEYHFDEMDNCSRTMTDEMWSKMDGLSQKDKHHILHFLLASNKWRPPAKGLTSITDQILHMVYPIVIFGVFGYGLVCTDSAYLFGSLAGFLLGTVREVEQFFNQDLRIPMLLDRLLDITTFVIGANILVFLLYRFCM